MDYDPVLSDDSDHESKRSPKPVPRSSSYIETPIYTSPTRTRREQYDVDRERRHREESRQREQLISDSEKVKSKEVNRGPLKEFSDSDSDDSVDYNILYSSYKTLKRKIDQSDTIIDSDDDIPLKLSKTSHESTHENIDHDKGVSDEVDHIQKVDDAINDETSVDNNPSEILTTNNNNESTDSEIIQQPTVMESLPDNTDIDHAPVNNDNNNNTDTISGSM